jgi:DNA repair protein RecN (Recombination protein N)
MLRSLRVRNLAIVDDVHVEFEDGLNVITGETGAGKSILVGALALLLGERADKSLIRSGEDRGAVEAAFQLENPAAVNRLLAELGLEPCEDGLLIVRRVLTASGSGRIHVNDGPATVQSLKRLGDLLVDLHGPHDHQSLLRAETQLSILDAAVHLEEVRARYAEGFREWTDLRKRRRELDGDDDSVALKLDMLSHQVREIEEAELREDEDELIEREHATTANATRILELADAVRHALTENDAAALNTLAFVQNQLTELAGLLDDGSAWLEEAKSAAIQIEELSRSIDEAAQRIEADPERLQWLEDRMALLHKLKRKHGTTVRDILAFRDRAEAELTDLQSRGERIEAVDRALREAERAVRANGKTLSAARRKASAALSKEITAHLRDLGFPHGAFEVALASSEPNPSGMDDVEFGFAPNVGEAMRPLRAIASSGEISRVMLAVKAVLAAHDRIPVLVFDEIDANVGGETGNAIGDKLDTVASGHQVLCITHLPQIAVHGATHFVVAKEVRDGRTYTRIRRVADKERIEEVARMLGGRDLTSVTVRHAREMLRVRK